MTAPDVPDVLTLYMMDHGDIDLFYLDKPRDEIVTPNQLDDWLDRLEEAVLGIKINVIIEACHAGSFIQAPNSISGPNRMIITSSDEENDAYASPSGAHFSDHFLTALREGDNLLSSWSRAKEVVEELFVIFPQRPWIDGDGNGTPNELSDFVEASRRGFAYAGTLGTETLWPPYIAQVTAPESLAENSGQISAEVRDDRGVSHVWAVVYPPSYVPSRSEEGNELLDEDLEQIRLTHKGDDIYRGRAYNFTESGTYRIAIHADDDHGLLARPVVVEFNTAFVRGPSGLHVFLPLISR